MILSRQEIMEEVDRGRIKFDPPLEESQWGEASVDLRLGCQFTWLKEVPGVTVSLAGGLKSVADAEFWETRDVEDNGRPGGKPGFEVKQGQFTLARTLERVTVPRDLIARVEGRSTYARFGLSMHQTAPWIQPGWEGSIVLELMNCGPITLKLTPVIEKPCQLTFFRLTSEVPEDEAYGAKPTDAYQHQQHPLRQN